MKKLFIPIIALLVISCTENRPKEEKILEDKAVEPIKEHIDKAYYPIPSPEQMLGFINDLGLVYNTSLMNPTENHDKYNDPHMLALNFGAYSADLAYSASHEDIDNTLELYKVVKNLTKQMEIADMMTEETMQSMLNSFENKDSLLRLAGQSYYQAVEFLEEHHQEGRLALFSLGGWVESIYITINSLEDFEAQSKSVQRIADQKITFGNLYTYLKKHEKHPGVSREIERIQKIRSVFASLEEIRSAKKTKQEGGNLVLGGGSRINITKEQFLSLKESINNYRNEITKV